MSRLCLVALLAVACAAPTDAVGRAPAFSLTIITSRYGVLSAVTTPGATCKAQARLPSGQQSRTRGLRDTKTSDAQGYVSWTYARSAQTRRGTGTHTVACSYSGQSQTATGAFTVP